MSDERRLVELRDQITSTYFCGGKLHVELLDIAEQLARELAEARATAAMTHESEVSNMATAWDEGWSGASRGVDRVRFEDNPYRAATPAREEPAPALIHCTVCGYLFPTQQEANAHCRPVKLLHGREDQQ